MDGLRFRFRIFIFLFFTIMLVGTLGFMFLEGLSPADAFYFSLVTVTTVGYGDIHPTSPAGKVLAVALIICGVGTFLGVVANATELLVDRREKKIRMQKLNMVIGVFYSELGTKLLAHFSQFDTQLDAIRESLVVKGQWSDEDFVKVKANLRKYPYKVDPGKLTLEELHTLLDQKGDFLLRLWENPNLLEHEAFTEVLRAVFHLKEELLSRQVLSGLPESDKAHIAGDINRAYGLLVNQWLDYMKHLKDHYPYLFSLAMRTNPFDREASPIIH
jgi:hypothetical protein